LTRSQRSEIDAHSVTGVTMEEERGLACTGMQVYADSRFEAQESVLHGGVLWSEQMDESFYYIDCHVRVYSGYSAGLPKHYVSREKLCLTATAEFYVNTFDGLPLMVIIGELNEKLKAVIEKAIIEIKKVTETAADKTSKKPLFTTVFDREAYGPKWFKRLMKEDRTAVISYRKNVKDKWDESLFEKTAVKVDNMDVTMRLCELGCRINDAGWFREVRKLQKIITHEKTMLEQINDFDEDINRLVRERKTVDSRIAVDRMPPDKQDNMLKQESKKLKNIIVMLAYRAESTLYTRQQINLSIK
jgi:hypothetical protein